MDLAVLLYHLGLSERHQNVGYNDADISMIALLSKLSQYIELSESDLERLLYASNLMDEQKEWKHPLGLSFETWLKDIMGHGESYHRVYNTIERKVS